MFVNSAGDLRKSALDALRAIGANQRAGILQQANAPFGDAGPPEVPEDNDERQVRFAGFCHEQVAALDALDQRHYACKENADLLLALEALEHKEHFSAKRWHRPIMNWLVYHIVSGQAFFSGIALVVVAALASTHTKPRVRRVTVLAFVIGVLAIVLSSTPTPYWYIGLAVLAVLGWIASAYLVRWRPWAAYALAAVALGAAGIEAPYHFSPSLTPAASRRVTIVGDSVTAGIGGNESSERWPCLLAREHGLQVQDISHMGETAASALKRARTHKIDSSVVVVEIGGNDVLGSTTADKFAGDLDALLTYLAAPNPQIVMFELPLPPFYHAYGRAQRAVAQRHNVQLIPKRVFLSVLAGSGSTLDTIHLSQSGHQQMAESVWRLLQPAFPPQRRAE